MLQIIYLYFNFNNYIVIIKLDGKMYPRRLFQRNCYKLMLYSNETSIYYLANRAISDL